MSTGLIIILIILFIGAIGGTFFAFRQEENKMKKYEEEGETIEQELKRSHDYETTSKSNITAQIWIYTIAILLSLIAFAIYIF
ncbi:hypothetical protein KFZ58_07860 [Virgibacillus sp. NKC19-16]|uniref:hypothetical protein n=1 Tax=Virgibacillus salidurans TaxID=2831673 RepID=UPI001F33A395|nr:hypothetical protein [Virgibacillus sp. NKC19-16]UJL47760.1 hypothetical protein KFZ58_07860 [Virgibacillus sp. NKC19-16]